MITIIVKFLEVILSFAAALIVVVLAIGGFLRTYSEGSVEIIDVANGVMGAIVGFILAAIFLGIPILLLKINRNLESINSRLAACSDTRITASERLDPPLQ